MAKLLLKSIKVLCFLLVFMIQSYGLASVISVNCNEPSEILKSQLQNNESLKLIVERDLNKLFEKMEVHGAVVAGETMEDFKKNILAVKVFTVPKRNAILGWGNFSARQEAVNFRNCMVVSEDLLDIRNSQGRLFNKYLLLHEAMGAAGYADVNFQFTSVLMMGESVLKENRISLPLIHRYKQTIPVYRKQLFQVFSDNAPLKISDGGTVVGSGGDSLLLALKTQILTSLFSGKIMKSGYQLERIPRAKLKQFFEFVRIATIDYVEEILDAGDELHSPSFKVNLPLVVNDVPQYLFTGVTDLSKPVLVVPVGDNTSRSFGLIVFLSQFTLLRNLSGFLKSVPGRSFLDEEVNLNDFKNDIQLRKHIENLVSNNVRNDIFVRKQFSSIENGTTTEGQFARQSEQFKNKLKDDLYLFVRNNKEALRTTTAHLDGNSDLSLILLISELYRDYQGIGDIKELIWNI
jgi:hypothetical protein